MSIFSGEKILRTLFAAGLIAAVPFAVAAAAGEADAGHGNFAATLLWIAVILVAAKLGGSLMERFRQPAVLGELLIGVILGNLGLVGLHILDSIAENQIISFLAEIGVVILLFQVGLESNVQKMRRVGGRAFFVALLGVAAPFALGAYIFGPMFFPGLNENAYIFFGATLTATSVGITARVFKDLNKLQIPEAQVVLGAAVIDDVMGLVILAVVSALVTLGTVGATAIGLITLKAVGFLVGAIILGQLAAPRLGELLSRIHTGIGMKFTLALSFGLILSWGAGEIGLAPIVGAFAAGLVLDPVHFRGFKEPEILEAVREKIADIEPGMKKKIQQELDLYSHKHVESLIEPLAFFLVPIFFVVTGMGVKLETLFDFGILGVALGVTIVAIVGKIVSGFAAGKIRKAVVGWGMVPRGEVGLIFATIGSSLGVVSAEMYSVIVIMVILTTLLTPPVLSYLIARGESVSGRMLKPAGAAEH